jgi:hypothetical protein
MGNRGQILHKPPIRSKLKSNNLWTTFVLEGVFLIKDIDKKECPLDEDGNAEFLMRRQAIKDIL